MATTSTKERKTRVRLTQSGQITLPARIRKRLGIELGDYVTISESRDGTIRIEPDRLLGLKEIMDMAVDLPDEVDIQQVLREAREVGMTTAVRVEKQAAHDHR